MTVECGWFTISDLFGPWIEYLWVMSNNVEKCWAMSNNGNFFGHFRVIFTILQYSTLTNKTNSFWFNFYDLNQLINWKNLTSYDRLLNYSFWLFSFCFMIWNTPILSAFNLRNTKKPDLPKLIRVGDLRFYKVIQHNPSITPSKVRTKIMLKMMRWLKKQFEIM